jgi:hypothetical protein
MNAMATDPERHLANGGRMARDRRFWFDAGRRLVAGGAVAALIAFACLAGVPGSAVAASWLDRGTASVLADDVGFDHYCDADCGVDLARCYRVDATRVDCVIIFQPGGDDPHQYLVIATKVIGSLLYFGDYWVKGHPRVVTRARMIRRSPQGFRLRPISHIYAKSWWTDSGYKLYYPNRLLARDAGYGRPRLRSVIRSQCRLQPRLHCSWRR